MVKHHAVEFSCIPPHRSVHLPCQWRWIELNARQSRDRDVERWIRGRIIIGGVEAAPVDWGKSKDPPKADAGPHGALPFPGLHLSPALLFISLLLSPTPWLSPPITASPHLNRLHSSLSFYTSFPKSLLTSQQESRDAECRNHKSGPAWNRRWLPWTAGRFFITGAFLVPFTTSAACHQTQAVLRVYERVFGTWKWKRGTELREVEMTRMSR